LIRRPERSYGTRRLVDLVRDAVADVRRDHAKLHTLAIGDLSARAAARSPNTARTTGRDVDVGFSSRRSRRLPAAFVVGTKANLDLPATWDLLVALARTADDRGGVSAIFLDYELQACCTRPGPRRVRGLPRQAVPVSRRPRRHRPGPPRGAPRRSPPRPHPVPAGRRRLPVATGPTPGGGVSGGRRGGGVRSAHVQPG
jgi:hypothetical protein